MRQDWQWPFTHGGVAAMLANLSAPVIPAEWDTIAWLPRLNLVQPIFLILNEIMSPAHTLKVFLFLTLLIGALGAFCLARSLGGNLILSVAAMVFYVAAPYVIDELVAGHLWLMLAYACAPGLIESLIRRRSWAVVFLWTATTSIDIHFLGLDILIGICLALSRVVPLRDQRGLFVGLIAFVPAIMGAIFASHSMTFEGQHTIPFYERVNSVSLVDAFQGVGYMAGYDRIFFSPWSPLLCIPPIVSLILVLQKKWLGALLVALGAFIASGVNGPFAMLEGWAFGHIYAASVFRELYDAVVLLNLGAVVALGSISLPTLSQGVIAAALVVTVMPGLGAKYQPLLKSFVIRHKDLALVQNFEREPGSSQLLALPAQIPISVASFPGGLDPIGNILAGHGVLGSEHVLPAPVRAGLSLPAPEARSWFAQLHTSAILYRPGWRSIAVYNLEPGFGEPRGVPKGKPEGPWKIVRLNSLPRVTVRPSELCISGNYRLIGGFATYVDDDPACGALKMRTPSVVYPYPSRGWVDYDSLWFLARGASDALPRALYTTKVGLAYPLPEGCQPDVSYAYDGLVLRGQRWAKFSRKMLGCRAPVVTSPTVLSGIHERLNGGGSPKRLLGVGHATALTNLSWLAISRIDSRGKSMLALMTQYSKYWVAYDEGRLRIGKHHLLEGLFNGWVVSGNGSSLVVLAYWPAIPIFGAEVIVFLIYIVACRKVLLNLLVILKRIHESRTACKED